MSNIALVSPATGTATFSITTPSGTSTDRTLTLPDAAGTIQVSGNPISGTTGTFTGLVDISAAGAGQIQFPATQNASANANTLDDYEEGTWTPAFTTVTGVSYSEQFGRYTKVGKVVHFNIFLVWSGSSPSGSSVVVSLPFAVGSGAAFIGACAYTANNVTLPSGVYEISMQLNNSNASFDVFGQRSGNTKLTFPPSNLSASGELVVSGHFEVA
jgi:hypothetical protein